MLDLKRAGDVLSRTSVELGKSYRSRHNFDLLPVGCKGSGRY